MELKLKASGINPASVIIIIGLETSRILHHKVGVIVSKI
jgi:hypothetical protein